MNSEKELTTDQHELEDSNFKGKLLFISVHHLETMTFTFNLYLINRFMIRYKGRRLIETEKVYYPR